MQKTTVTLLFFIQMNEQFDLENAYNFDKHINVFNIQITEWKNKLQYILDWNQKTIDQKLWYLLTYRDEWTNNRYYFDINWDNNNHKVRSTPEKAQEYLDQLLNTYEWFNKVSSEKALKIIADKESCH
jgi:hypothetical protein